MIQISNLSPRLRQRVQNLIAEKMNENLNKGNITTEKAVEAAQNLITEKEYNEAFQPNSDFSKNNQSAVGMFVNAAITKQKNDMVQNLNDKKQIINDGLQLIGGNFSNTKILGALSDGLIGYLQGNNISKDNIDNVIDNDFKNFLTDLNIEFTEADLVSSKIVLDNLINMSANKDGVDNSLSLMDFNKIVNEYAVNANESDMFERWTEGNDLDSNYQYVKLGNNAEEFTSNVYNFAQNYINQFGNNDGNLSLEEFTKLTGLDEESSKAIFETIDIDKKGGIKADEFAAYLMTLDRMDGIADGKMNLDDYNTWGAEISVISSDKYKGIAVNETATEMLAVFKQKMTEYHDTYFSKMNKQTVQEEFNEVMTKYNAKIDTAIIQEKLIKGSFKPN